MTEVPIIDGRGQLDLECNNPAVRALEDEIDLVLATPCPQVPHLRLVDLRIGANRQCHERFKEGSEQRAVPRYRGADFSPIEKGGSIDSEETSRQRRVGKLVDRSGCEAAKVIPTRRPRWHLLDHPELLQCGAIRRSGRSRWLLVLTSRTGISNGLKRRRGRGGCGVRNHPAPKGIGIPHTEASLREVMLDDSIDVAVELRPQTAALQRTKGREAGRDDLLDVPGEIDWRRPFHWLPQAGQQIANTHRRLRHTSLSQRHRPHADGDDSSCARVRRSARWRRRAGE